jgi:hypothetical protein
MSIFEFRASVPRILGDGSWVWVVFNLLRFQGLFQNLHLTAHALGAFLERLRKFFFWREKSGPGRRIEHPIGQSKYPKSPNPTVQPCWVHPTKSQNSLQEVDRQFSPPAQPPRYCPIWRILAGIGPVTSL